MTESTTELPPKPEVALALLQTALSVYVHLDPRPDDVHVPSWLKKQPQLVLQVGMNMAVAIPDLDVGQDALSCTLSFNRRPEFCRIPWTAIYGLVGDDGRGMIWPDSIPPEVAAAAEGRAAGPKKDGAKKDAKRRLRAVSSDEGAAEEEGATQAEAGSDEPATPAEVAPPRKKGRGARGASAASSEEASHNAAVTAGIFETDTDSPSQKRSEGEEGTSEPRRTDKEPAAKKERPAYLRLVK